VKSAQFAIALDKLLQQENFPSTCFHRQMAQDERIKRFNAFKNFEKRVMVSTDIFGRGIDIEKINVVFNYDMPEDADSYLHRVGRAGRFGTKGLAISFISSPENQKTLEDIQKRFEVKIQDLPSEIDENSYMNN
jgi:ATP-dependent RNA helicase UAP56/SUB2